MTPANDNARLLAAWACGGDVIVPGGPISLAQARKLCAFHSRYAIEADGRGDRGEARKAALISIDYHAAIQGAEKWRASWRIAR